MTEIFKALYAFLSGVGIPLYPENGVPSDAVFPYLTYTPIQTDWDSDAPLSVRLWDRSQSYERLAGYADKLRSLLAGGTVLEAGEAGYIYLYEGNPWAQPQPLQDSVIKVLYLNIGISTMII